MTDDQSPVDGVQLRSVSKTFAGITVLKGVDLDLRRGEVHGLIGENGSGKSTLVKILGGLYTPDDGATCTVWGNELSFPVVRPQQHGIAIIHQDLALIDTMSVAENVGISSAYGTRTLGAYRRRRERNICRKQIRDLQLSMDPDDLVAKLAPAERSMVAIMRAMRLMGGQGQDHVLILDEPTAALTRDESDRLLKMIRSLAANGAAILFIGHRLAEVLSVCDRVSVLRDGSLIDTVAVSDATDSLLVELMLGFDIGAFYPERHKVNTTQESFSVSGLSARTVNDLSFSVSPGEIAGVTGLSGMGQDEVPYLIYGHDKPTAGRVLVEGREVRSSVLAAVKAGIALVPGNRQRDAVWMSGSAAENLTLPMMARFSSKWFLRLRRERDFAAKELRRFGVRPLMPAQEVARFSGGNQQKIVLARWLNTGPKVLLLHEPTQGVDAGAKKELFELIREAAESGAAVIIFSSDIDEVVNMCHRVLVMRHGSITVEIPQHQLTEERIMAACQGRQPSSGPRPMVNSTMTDGTRR